MKREDLPSSEVLASIGLAAAGAVAGLVARALVLSGKVVAAGLETVEHLLAGDRPADPSSSATVTDLRDRRDERAAEDIEAAPWADGVDTLPTEPDFAAFEPADGLIPTTGRSPRRSAAGAGRTTARPRPAKRATGRSVPPPLRPVPGGPPVPDDAPSPSTADPIKGAAEATDLPTAGKGTAAKKTAAKTTAAKKAAPRKAAAKRTAAKTPAVTGDATKKAATPGTATENAETTPSTPPSTAPSTAPSTPPSGTAPEGASSTSAS